MKVRMVPSSHIISVGVGIALLSLEVLHVAHFRKLINMCRSQWAAYSSMVRPTTFINRWRLVYCVNWLDKLSIFIVRTSIFVASIVTASTLCILVTFLGASLQLTTLTNFRTIFHTNHRLHQRQVSPPILPPEHLSYYWTLGVAVVKEILSSQLRNVKTRAFSEQILEPLPSLKIALETLLLESVDFILDLVNSRR